MRTRDKCESPIRETQLSSYKANSTSDRPSALPNEELIFHLTSLIWHGVV